MIVGSSGINVSSISATDVKKLYLGKTNTIGGVAVNLADCESLKQEFLDKFIGKSAKQYDRIWLKKVFAEGLSAPIALKTSDDVIKFVKSSPNAIGYVSSTSGGVKTLSK